ncbi:MAG: hypothetical protein GYA23_00270 [Methanomicrobiales archaeon]|nr:hypothetical protein [Methanomicrobiales archaeon]
MIEQLPEGKSIGWMQAPPQWIFTHTVRFIGIVRIVIQDGEGFILIQKGKPLTYYFKHGRIEMRGHAALDYFNSHPTIEFNLCKYTQEEFAEALRICNVDDAGQPLPPPEPERKPEVVVQTPAAVPERPPAAAPPVQPVPAAPQAPPIQPRPAPAPEPVFEKRVVQPPQAPPVSAPAAPAAHAPVPPSPPAPAPVRAPAPEPAPAAAAPVAEEQPVVRPQARAVPPPPMVFAPKAEPSSPAAGIPVSPPVVLDEGTIRIIGQIKKLNGVVAISVFNEDRNILLMGDVEIEPLLKIARNMLATTQKITPLIEWGSFVHMTLQIPEGNVIVAPYNQYHLCLLTTRTINIGHIRRILRDIQGSST